MATNESDWFRLDHLQKECPQCRLGRLDRVVVDRKPVAYYCIARRFGDTNCRYKFDVSSVRPNPDGSSNVYGKAENPAYLARLDSPELDQNLMKAAEMEAAGVQFFLDVEERLLETLTPDEVRQLVEPRAR